MIGLQLVLLMALHMPRVKVQPPLPVRICTSVAGCAEKR